MTAQGQPQPVYPRYVAAMTRGGYVVYDRWDARVADGHYLTLVDAQWAADQRNQTFAAAQRQQAATTETTETTQTER